MILFLKFYLIPVIIIKNSHFIRNWFIIQVISWYILNSNSVCVQSIKSGLLVLTPDQDLQGIISISDNKHVFSHVCLLRLSWQKSYVNHSVHSLEISHLKIREISLYQCRSGGWWLVCKKKVAIRHHHKILCLTQSPDFFVPAQSQLGVACQWNSIPPSRQELTSNFLHFYGRNKLSEPRVAPVWSYAGQGREEDRIFSSQSAGLL